MELYAEAGRLGLVIPLNRFRERVGGEPALRKILRALSVTEKVHPGKPRGMARITRKAYSIQRRRGAEDVIIIPRIKGAPFLRARTKAGLPLLDGIRAASADGDNAPLRLPRRIAEDRLAETMPLYGYQEAAVSYLCSDEGPLGATAVDEHRGAVFLQMDTGLGKTRVGCAVIARRAEPALIVVPTEAIAIQWIDELKDYLPGMTAKLFRNPPKNSRKVPPSPETHDVVVVIINTFRAKEPDFMEGFGTVVLDEAHEYHSTMNSRALWLSQTRAVIGLSATPAERKDGLDLYVHLHLGSVLYPKNIPDFDVNAVNFTAAVRLVEYEGHPDHCETEATPAGTMSAILTIGNIIEDKARMRLVAAEVDRLYHLHETASPDELKEAGLGPRPADVASKKHPEGGIRRHGVFVFAEHRRYLPSLRAALLERMDEKALLVPELDPAPAPAVSILRGGVAKNAVNDAREEGSHVVLTTYGFSRRGISLPEMTSIVLATPRRNGGNQILGRVFRRGSDESIVRQIVDVVDVRTGLKGQLTDRKKLYKLRGYKMSKVAASWDQYAEAGAEVQDEHKVEDQVDEFAEVGIDDLLAMAMGEGPVVAKAAPDAEAISLADEDIDAILYPDE